MLALWKSIGSNFGIELREKVISVKPVYVGAD